MQRLYALFKQVKKDDEKKLCVNNVEKKMENCDIRMTSLLRALDSELNGKSHNEKNLFINQATLLISHDLCCPIDKLVPFSKLFS